MPKRFIAIAQIILFFSVFITCGCFAMDSGNRFKSDTLTYHNAAHTIDSLALLLKGEWVISRLIYLNDPDMSKEVAKQWIGKKVVIYSHITFDLKKVLFYEGLFSKQQKDHPFKIDDVILYHLRDFYSDFKTDPKSLGIKGDVVQAIETSQDYIHFGLIIILDQNTILTLYDGVWFVCKRQK
jgi:hypothetical protein